MTLGLRIAVGIASLSLAALHAAAQSAPASRVDTAAAACTWPPATADSSHETVHLTMAPVSETGVIRRRLSAVERAQFGLALQQIRSHVELPEPAVLVLGPDTPLYQPGGMHHAAPAVPALGVGITFTLHADGRVTGTALDGIRSAMPVLDSTLVRALAEAEARGELAGLLLRPDGAPAPDSMRVRLGAGLTPDTAVATLPALNVTLPQYDFRPVLPKPGNPGASYPQEALRRGVESEVLMQYVIGTDGRVDLSTARVLRAEYREFIQSVAAVLPKLRFTPATLGGCVIRQLVQHPFVFQIWP